MVVEHVSSDDALTSRPPQIGSREEFLAMLDQAHQKVVARILDRFQDVSDASDDGLYWDFRAATVNLYWRAPEGGSRRVLSINRDGLFRVWLGYLAKHGYSREAEMVREQAQIVMDIEAGDHSGKVFPDTANIDAVLGLIDEVAGVLTDMG